MELNCKLQALADLTPRKKPPVSFGQELRRPFAEFLIPMIENKATN
jgi:hypothetical protein